MARKINSKKKKPAPVEEVYIPYVQEDHSKQDAVYALKAKGYDAFAEDGVVMVSFEYNGGTKEMTAVLKEVEKILKEVGYNRSFGCRAKRRDDG